MVKRREGRIRAVRDRFARSGIGRALTAIVDRPVDGVRAGVAVGRLAEFVVGAARDYESSDGLRRDLPSAIRVVAGAGHAETVDLRDPNLVPRVRNEVRRRILEDVGSLAARGDAIVTFYGLDELTIEVEDAEEPSAPPRFEVLQPFRGGSRVGPILEIYWAADGRTGLQQVIALEEVSVGRGLEGHDADVTIPDLDPFLGVSREAITVTPNLANGTMRCRVAGPSGVYHVPEGGTRELVRVNGVITLEIGDEIWLTPDGSAILRYPADPEGVA